MAYQPIRMILKCITFLFCFLLNLGKEVCLWIYLFTIYVMLVILSSMKTVVKVCTTVISTTLQAMSFWPRFYWSLLGPSSQGRSISTILHHGFRVSSSLRTEANRSKRMQHDLSHVLDCLGVYSSSVQVPRASKHLAQSPNRSMAEAVTQALPKGSPCEGRLLSGTS